MAFGWASYLNASEDSVGVYSILGTTEDGGCVVLTLVPCAVAANKKMEVGSRPPFGNAESYLLL